MPGNVALLDVILALQWIQKNIRSFGGDPTRVTIFGQSSGGVMVSALAMSPAVPDNLFQRVIAQSGSALANWCYARSPVANARDIAARAGLSTNLTLAELYSHLSNLDVVTLLNATNEHNVCRHCRSSRIHIFLRKLDAFPIHLSSVDVRLPGWHHFGWWTRTNLRRSSQYPSSIWVWHEKERPISEKSIGDDRNDKTRWQLRGGTCV